MAIGIVAAMLGILALGGLAGGGPRHRHGAAAMTIAFRDDWLTVYQGDVRAVLPHA
jgi:hypothetical protein